MYTKLTPKTTDLYKVSGCFGVLCSHNLSSSALLVVRIYIKCSY